MSMEKIFGVAGSALAAQLVRMNTTASNLANASNTAPTEEEALKQNEWYFARCSMILRWVTKLDTRAQLRSSMSLMTHSHPLNHMTRAIPLQMETATSIKAMSTKLPRWWK